jgi:hypothetical protein
MEARQELVYESIKKSLVAARRVEQLAPEIATLRADLEDALKEIDQLRQTQHALTSRRTGLGPEIAKVRDDIGKRLRQISNLAVVHLRGLPGIRDDVRPPKMNVSNASLIEGTGRVIRNVQPHIETLYNKGLPRNSIARLEALSRELSQMAIAPNEDLAARARATSSLPEALKRGRDVVRAIDSSMKVALAHDATAMRVWEVAKRIPRKPGRPRKKKGQGNGPPAS